MMPGAKSRLIEAIAIVAALAVMAALLLGGIRGRSDQIDYLLRDQAHYLFSAQQVLDGHLPYRDFFWSYGPIPLYSYSVLGYISGISPQTFLAHQAIWNFIAASLCLLLMQRWFGLMSALAAFFLTSFFWMSTPDAIYVPLERVGVILIAGLWAPPRARTWRRDLFVGVVLGLVQGIKFGTAFALGLAWVIMDVLWLMKGGGLRLEWRGWLASLWRIAGGFCGVMAVWVGAAFLGMDARAAGEFLLPLYHVKWYQSYVTSEDRWFKFLNWGYFFGLQLRFIASGLIAVGFGVWFLRRPAVRGEDGTRGPAMGPMLLAVCYGVGCVFLFRHVYNLISYGWLLAPIVGFALSSSGWVPRTLAVVALLPSAALIPREVMRDLFSREAAPPTVRPFVSTAGKSLLLGAEDAAALSELEAGLRVPPRVELATGAGLILGPKYLGGRVGSGYHWILNVSPATRNTWFFAGAVAGSESEAEFLRSCRARFIAIKVDAAAIAGAGEDALTALAIRELPFAEEKNREALTFFAPPVTTPTGWLIFWRQP